MPLHFSIFISFGNTGDFRKDLYWYYERQVFNLGSMVSLICSCSNMLTTTYEPSTFIPWYLSSGNIVSFHSSILPSLDIHDCGTDWIRDHRYIPCMSWRDIVDLFILLISNVHLHHIYHYCLWRLTCCYLRIMPWCLILLNQGIF